MAQGFFVVPMPYVTLMENIKYPKGRYVPIYMHGRQIYTFQVYFTQLHFIKSSKIQIANGRDGERYYLWKSRLHE